MYKQLDSVQQDTAVLKEEVRDPTLKSLIITHIFWDTLTSHDDEPSYIEEATIISALAILSTCGSKNLWVMISA
jgi:hypothetical protein